MFAPLPGLAFLGLGYARPILWLNKIRKSDDPLAFATASAWRKYKTASAVASVTGAVSVVGYYRGKYVQDAAWSLAQGEKPESVVQWMQDEHNVPFQEAVAIVLQLHRERQEFLKSGLGGRTSHRNAGTEARSFFDMDGLSLLKSISTPTPKARMSWTSSKKSPGSIGHGSGRTKASGERSGRRRTRTRPWWFSTKAKRRISRKRS